MLMLGVQSGVYTLSSGSKLFRGINTGLKISQNVGFDFFLLDLMGDRNHFKNLYTGAPLHTENHSFLFQTHFLKYSPKNIGLFLFVMKEVLNHIKVETKKYVSKT